MIKVNESYKKVIESSNRPKSYFLVKYGVYNKAAKSSISNVDMDNSQSFSNSNKVYNGIKTTDDKYITCEPDRVILDGSFNFVRDKNSPSPNENIAYWSSILSEENGEIGNTPYLTLEFNQEIEFSELTLYFQEVCSAFIARYYLNNTLVATREVSNNESLIVETSGNIVVSKYNKIEIEFIATKEPYRYVKLNEIDFGRYLEFTQEEIGDFDIIEEVSIDSSELSSNSFNLRIKNFNNKFDLLNPNNKLSSLQERQSVQIYHYLKVNDKFQEIPLGSFLVKNFNTRNKELNIEAYDDIYFENNKYYGSNFYLNTSIKEILLNLFNYFDYGNYILDNSLDDIKLSGYIKPMTFREALRTIAEAGCCIVKKERTGQTKILKVKDTGFIDKSFKGNIVFKPNIEKNSFNRNLNISSYEYTARKDKETIYKQSLKAGTYTISYMSYPIVSGSLQKSASTSSNNYNITKEYATSCVIEVLEDCLVELIANVYETEETITQITDLDNSNKAIDVNNTLISDSNLEDVINWKLSRKELKYSLETILIPYIETGDKCVYVNPYTKQNMPFIPTRIEFSNSLKQIIEGE